MSSYNNLLQASVFSFDLLCPNLTRFLSEFIVAYPLALFFTGRIVPPLVNKVVPRNKDLLKILLIPCGIALIMAPLMTSYIHMHYLGFSNIDGKKLLKNILMNLIFAYAIQVLLLGPFVRFIFLKIKSYLGYKEN